MWSIINKDIKDWILILIDIYGKYLLIIVINKSNKRYKKGIKTIIIKIIKYLYQK